MKDAMIDAKNQRMLELLAVGSTSRVIAKQMGYQEGTMRVYLHNLYRRIGVANKTEAVVWYLNREKSRDDLKAEKSAQRPTTGDVFGDMALEEDLFATLGVMSQFTGPYGRVWEVAQRLEGTAMDEKMSERRGRARLLWRALLKGDWAYGKRIYDADMGGAISLDAPSDAVLLAALLVAGGFSLAGDRLASQLTDKRKAGRGVTTREATLMRLARDAFQAQDAQAAAALQKFAGEKSSAAVIKQAAMVLAFHAFKARSEDARARQCANAMWAEAESARKHLEAMGERPLGGEAAFAAPAKAVTREKATAGAR